MLTTNIILSLVICLVTGADFVLLFHLQRVHGLICTIALSVAYMANIFAMTSNLYVYVAPTELAVNAAVLVYQMRRTWVLIQMANGNGQKLPHHLRQKANG